jgi:TP901 family phage tail tape measure protein
VAIAAGAALTKLGLVGGVAFAGLATLGVKSAGDLQEAVNNISTIKPDIDTSAVFKSLNEISTRVPQSAQQLGDSLYNIFSSISINQKDALSLVEKFAKGAIGAQTDADTWGTAMLGVMNAYGKGLGDVDKIQDTFFNTINAGVVNGKQLASSLGPVTASAKTAGLIHRGAGRRYRRCHQRRRRRLSEHQQPQQLSPEGNDQRGPGRHEGPGGQDG